MNGKRTGENIDRLRKKGKVFSADNGPEIASTAPHRLRPSTRCRRTFVCPIEFIFPFKFSDSHDALHVRLTAFSAVRRTWCPDKRDTNKQIHEQNPNANRIAQIPFIADSMYPLKTEQDRNMLWMVVRSPTTSTMQYLTYYKCKYLNVRAAN